MNQEDVLVLLVVFVLGFVVSRMMSGRLLEGGIFDDIGDDFKDDITDLGKDIHSISKEDPFTTNQDVDGVKPCTHKEECQDACGGVFQNPDNDYECRETILGNSICHCIRGPLSSDFPTRLLSSR